MKVSLSIKDLQVAKIHKVSGPWVVLELPPNFSPRFLHVKEGDSYSLDMTVSGDSNHVDVTATAADSASVKALIAEVAEKLGL
jgi:hypothetical protein